MKKTITLICVIALIAGFSLPLFAGGGQSRTSSAAGAGKKHFVFVTPLVAHPVWLAAKDGFDAAARDYDFRGDWVGPSVIDADEMIKQIEVAIAEKADGIITQGINPEAMVPVLKKADTAGIPVVVVNSDIPDAPRLAYLGTDPTNLGALGAEAIVKKLNGKAPKVVYMMSVLDYKIGQDMVTGYRNVFSKQPGYEEKAVMESKADMLIGVSKWQDVFNTYPDINVAVCVSGEAGASCAKVVTEMGLQNKITIMAIDDIDETLDRIKEGVIYGTMTQNFYRKGYQSSQWLLDYINNGKKPPKLLNDSGTMLVTKDNIDTYKTDMTKPETWK
jgi:ABC-type sugar transport system substrate-binding protein